MRHVLGAAAAGLALALPWLADAYTVAVAGQALAFAVLALSVHVHTGLAGLPTLGQGAYLAAGGYVAARLARDVEAAGMLQLLAAAGAGAAIAAVTGLAVARTRGVVAVMLTLAITELAHTTATRWRSGTGGSDGLTVPATPVWPGGPPLVRDGHVYLWLLLIAAASYVLVLALARTPYGLALTGTADSEARMAAVGYPVTRLLWTAHVFAGGLAGLAGGMWVAAHRYLSPSDVGLTTSALALLAVVIGGLGSATGAILGAVTVVAIDEYAGAALTGDWAGHGGLLLGVLFVACVYLLPIARRRLAMRGQSGGADA